MAYLLIACRTPSPGVFVAAPAGEAHRRSTCRDFVKWVGTLGLVPRRLTAPVLRLDDLMALFTTRSEIYR